MNDDTSPGSVVYVVGQLAGKFEAFLERYDQDQTNAKDFRKFMRDSHDELKTRVTTLEMDEKVQAEPRKWLVWVLRISGGAALLTFANKLIAKVHWG